MDRNNYLYEEIVRLAFEKVTENIVKKSLKAKTEYLEDNIVNGFNAKTYERYYKKYFTKDGNDFENPSEEVLNGIAVFIGFENFQDFKVKQQEQKSTKPKEENVNKSSNNANKPKETKNSNIPPEIVLKSNSKSLKLAAIIFVSIAFIAGYWLLNDLFIKEKTQPTTVIYNTYNGNLNYYYYSTKKDGKILLYNHLQPNNNLKPVTKEVMLTYFKQQLVEVTNEDEQRWFKVNLKETEGTKEVENSKISIVKIEEKNVEKSINTTIITIKNNAILDAQISAYFKQLYAKTNKPYIAKGTVIYNYKPSSTSNQLVVCELVLTYNVKLYNSKTIFEVNSIMKTASGFSESDAKNNAIKKIQFN